MFHVPGDLKVPAKPYRPPSRDIPKSSPISPMPDREPPKRPPNNASHPARSPPQSSARSPPQFSARSPPQLSGRRYCYNVAMQLSQFTNIINKDRHYRTISKL